MWTLCLSVENIHPKGRHIVKVPETATVADLYGAARTALSASATVGAAVPLFRLKGGVPSRPLSEQDSTTLLSQVGMRTQDKVFVEITVIADASTASTAAAKPKTNKKNTKTATKTTTTPRKRPATKKRKTNTVKDDMSSDDDDDNNNNNTTTPLPPRSKSKRAAAQKATESFPETLAAQDAFLLAAHAQQSNSKPSKTKKTNNKKASTKTPRPKFPSHSVGRRLHDGAEVAPRRRRPNPSNNNLLATNNMDPSEALLTGLTQSKTKAGTLLRQNYKQAVANAYEQNKAVARLAAIPHQVTIQRVQEEDNQDRNQDQHVQRTTKLRVTFDKGVQGRGSFVEDVDFLPHDVLQQVVAAVYKANPQALRPTNLALLSPRVLWSTLYHYPNATTVEMALQQLQPTLDWTFLRHRVRNLSAKAQENLRQQQQQEQQATDGAAQDWEAAAAAIASVETAMEHLVRDTPQPPDQGTLSAAVGSESTATLSWHLTTPNEVDEDELRTCVAQAPYGNNNNEHWVQQLLTKCHIHNWRELANVAVIDDVLLRQLSILPVGQDNNTANATAAEAAVQCVTTWVTHAQQESIDEIIVEICDGRVDVVEVLTEYARSGTPKDLAAWQAIVPELHRIVYEGYASRRLRHNSNGSNDDNEEEDATSSCPSVAELATWCQRAVTVLTEYPWTAAFVTPLSAD